MKRPISRVRLLFNIQLVHLFSNTFETARYNMIIHVMVFLVCIFDARLPYAVRNCSATLGAYKYLKLSQRAQNVSLS